MTKADLIKKIQETGNYKKLDDAANALVAVGLALSVALSNGHDAALPHVGAFHVKTREERGGRNPRTGEPVIIPAKKVIKFTVNKALDQLVNQ